MALVQVRFRRRSRAFPKRLPHVRANDPTNLDRIPIRFTRKLILSSGCSTEQSSSNFRQLSNERGPRLQGTEGSWWSITKNDAFQRCVVRGSSFENSTVMGSGRIASCAPLAQ